jgi:hypothetical protein
MADSMRAHTGPADGTLDGVWLFVSPQKLEG